MSYQLNIQQAALENTDFRRELYTTDISQVVLMCVQPGEDIGLETHHDHDQLLFFVSGRADTILDNHRGSVGAGEMVVVPAGTLHNFINKGNEPLKLYTIYAPPEHAPGTVHHTRAEAVAAEAAAHGQASGATEATGGMTVGSLLGAGSPA